MDALSLTVEIILAAVVLTLFIAIVLFMRRSKKRFQKRLTDQSMQDTEGYNNGMVTLYRPVIKNSQDKRK